MDYKILLVRLLDITIIIFGFIRCFAHLMFFYFHRNKSIIQADTRYWLIYSKKNYSKAIGFIYLMSFSHPFRNLFYYRIGYYSIFLNFLCSKMSTLIIDTKKIGEGLIIESGFATAIGANTIGKNCLINQQVTIGYNNGACPTIGDNVIIRAGAIIVGNVTIGNNVIIGVNATVLTNVPDNCTVFPAASRIMKWNKKSTSDFKTNDDTLKR
jgi:serine O-acetyltransferase